MSKKTERILVVPADKFPEGMLKTGVKDLWDDEFEELLKYAEYHPRYLMEDDPNYKQIIPYIMVKDNVRSLTNLLIYERSSKSGEGRLHNKYSIGVGGHLDQNEEAPFESGIECFWDGAAREFKEELGIEASIADFELLATVYDDRDDVGKVHFGIVLGYTLEDGDIIDSGETDILVNRELVDAHGLKERLDSMENWSKMILASALS